MYNVTKDFYLKEMLFFIEGHCVIKKIIKKVIDLYISLYFINNIYLFIYPSIQLWEKSQNYKILF